MPKMVVRYEIPPQYANELAERLVRAGGKGGISRAARLIGVHRDTLMRGLRRRAFGQRVGARIIEALRPSTPHIGAMLVLTFE